MAEKIDSELEKLLQEIEDAEIAGATEAELPIDKKSAKSKSAKSKLEESKSAKSKLEESKPEESKPEESQSDEIDRQLAEIGLDPNDLKEDDEEEDDEEEKEEEDEDLVEAEVIDDLNEEQNKLRSQMMELVTKHCGSSDKMFEEAEVDRKRAEDIINIILPRIAADNYKAADIQTVAALLQTKADISRNRSAMMDSISRLFAALKNNPSIEVKSGGETHSKDELKKLLGGNPK